MRIIGIDPGYAIVGYGVLDYEKTRFSVVNYGAITTAAGTSFDRRLMEIYDDMCTVLDTVSYTHLTLPTKRIV